MFTRLRASIRLNTPDPWTPLHTAVKMGYAMDVRAILRDTPQIINAQTQDGDTALHFAAIASYSDSNRCEIIAALREAKADETIRNHLGETAFGKRIPFSTLNKWTMLHHAARDGDYSAVVWSLHGATPKAINAQTRDGNTALHFSAGHGNPSSAIVEVLLAAGADPTIRNHLGNTALEEAQAALHADNRKIRWKQATREEFQEGIRLIDAALEKREQETKEKAENAHANNPASPTLSRSPSTQNTPPTQSPFASLNSIAATTESESEAATGSRVTPEEEFGEDLEEAYVASEARSEDAQKLSFWEAFHEAFPPELDEESDARSEDSDSQMLWQKVRRRSCRFVAGGNATVTETESEEEIQAATYMPSRAHTDDDLSPMPNQKELNKRKYRRNSKR